MHLDTVQEIERAIDTLTPQQRDQLYQWSDDRYPQPINTQLKADLDAGRINNRINRALAEQNSGRIQSPEATCHIVQAEISGLITGDCSRIFALVLVKNLGWSKLIRSILQRIQEAGRSQRTGNLVCTCDPEVLSVGREI